MSERCCVRMFIGLAVLCLLLPAAAFAQVIQTQAVGGAGLSVDVMRASASQGVVTVVLQYRNTGRQEVALRYFAIDDVWLISPAEKKRYYVIQDSNKNWFASPVARSTLGYETGGGVSPVKVAAGGSVNVWFKFPSPPASVAAIDLIVPDVLPFEHLPISR